LNKQLAKRKKELKKPLLKIDGSPKRTCTVVCPAFFFCFLGAKSVPALNKEQIKVLEKADDL
jgi:hypothetical protein